MDIIVHYPKTEEDQNRLKMTVAMVHADLIAAQLNSLTCSDEQKCMLLKSISDDYKKNLLSRDDSIALSIQREA